MKNPGFSLAALHRRLLPLYISAFFQSFVLWYTIEKLFMQHIGFNNATIGLMVALYSAVMLVFEIPSGILADRWSRKGVLIIASFCLSLSALICGLSNGIGIYLVGAMFWGVFFACYSGMYDSIIYDTIIESTGKSKLYDHIFGRVQVMESIALITSSILGALLAARFSLRVPYYFTIVLSLVPVLALLKFNEPTLHKQQTVLPFTRQLRDTIRAVTKEHALLPVIITLVLQSTITYCIYEFAQLWLIALHMPTAYFGVANAVLLASLGAGGILVSRLHLYRYVRMAYALVLLLISAVGLITLRNTALIVLAQFGITTGLVCIHIIFSRILHDNLAPNIRAGASSAAATLGRLLIIPAAVLIGYVGERFSIFTAAYILLVLTALMSLFVLVVASQNGRTGLHHQEDSPAT